jgi:hypothetical protein
MPVLWERAGETLMMTSTGTAITNMYESRGLAGDNVSMRIKTSKFKGSDSERISLFHSGLLNVSYQ